MHVCYPRYIPASNWLIECFCTREHAPHHCYLGYVPVPDWLVECNSSLKQTSSTGVLVAQGIFLLANEFEIFGFLRHAYNYKMTCVFLFIKFYS